MYPKRIIQTVKQKCKYFRQNMTNVIEFFVGFLGSAGFAVIMSFDFVKTLAFYPAQMLY
jgi:hypothetical protein